MSVFAEATSYSTAREIGKRLGLSESTVRRLADRHAIFAPSINGLPGEEERRTARWHPEQVRLIELVLLGRMAADEALEEWRGYQAALERREPYGSGRGRRGGRD